MTSNTVFLHVQSGGVPVIATQPQSRTRIFGDSAEFSVSATGATSYQWYHNGTALAGQTNATLSLSNLQTSDAGDYTVVVTNASGAVTARTRVLMTPEEIDQAVKKTVSYTPPGR